MPNYVFQTSVMSPVSSNDHCTVTVTLNFKLPKEKSYYRQQWMYRDGDFDSFKNTLLITIA